MQRLAATYDTQDIVDALLECHALYRTDTESAANALRRSNTRATCKAVYDFASNIVRYKLDPKGYQLCKRPSRTIKERTGDCKSISLLIGSLLYNLGIPFAYRFAGYNGDNYTHVYVVATDGTKEIVLDPVWGKFDSQKRYTSKKDYTMEKGLYIGSTASTGFNPNANYRYRPEYKLLYQKFAGPIDTALDRLTDRIRQYVVPQMLPSALALVDAVKRNVNADPNMVMVYNAYSNAYIDGKITWVQFVQYLAMALSYMPEASVSGVFDSVGDAIKNAADSAADFFKKTGDAIGSKFVQFTDWAGNKITSAAEAAKSAADWVANKAKNVAVNVANGVKDFASDPVQFIKTEAKNAWKAIKTVGLAIPRQSYRALVALNFRGYADKLASRDPNEVKRAWERVGGDYGDLVSAIRSGKAKPPLIGAEPATSATIAAIVASAATIIAALAAILKDAKSAGNDAKKLAQDLGITPREAEDAIDKLNQFNAAEADAAANGDPDALQYTKNNSLLYAGLGLVALGLFAFVQPNSRKG